MVTVDYDKHFKKVFSKIKDATLKEKIKNQIRKVVKHPEIGKPMKHSRKETREVYVKSFRLSYAYVDDRIIFLDLYHKDVQ